MKFKRFDLGILTLTATMLFVFTNFVVAEEHDHHDVIIGLTDISSGSQQISLIETSGTTFELDYNHSLGLYYGGQACWIPADGDLHIMEPYGNGTPPAGHYQLELVAVDMPESLIAFDSESVSQILNTGGYVLDQWHWEDAEGWHFHNHISWGLNPALVTVGETITASFMLVDSTGQFADSDVFTLSFTAVPEPATLGLLALGMVILQRKNPKR